MPGQDIFTSSMPPWLCREEYPFTSRFFDLSHGRMHYVDEGAGDPIVMCHGNPTWSFCYRHLIKGLSSSYRCIAPDYLGFGLSDKPASWSYLPELHAENLERFLNHLELSNITLVVQDWGGPIGLSYALKYPEKIKSLILMNTWMWPVKGDLHFELFSKIMGGEIGSFLITRYNFFARFIMKAAFGDKKKFPRTIHEQYLFPLRIPEERKGTAVFPREIIRSSEWLRKLWDEREKIASKKAVLLWGKKDIAFRDKELKRWEEVFHDKEVRIFAGVGHFVQEECGEEIVPLIRQFLG